MIYCRHRNNNNNNNMLMIPVHNQHLHINAKYYPDRVLSSIASCKVSVSLSSQVIQPYQYVHDAYKPPTTLKYLRICHMMISPHFYARQHICHSAYMPWQFRLSVCLSVCPSVTRVDQSKTVEARITQFSPYSSPIPLVFRG